MELDNVEVPKSTRTMIVFPWTKSGNKFERKDYDPSQTNGRSSKEDIDDFLTIMDQIVNERAQSDLFDAAVNMLKWGIPLGMILCLIEGALKFQMSSFVLLGFFWVISWQLAGILKKQKSKSKAEKLKQSLVSALKEKSFEERYKIFDKKKLRWKIPQYFPKWIELHKDYEKPDDVEVKNENVNKDKTQKEEPKKEK